MLWIFSLLITCNFLCLCVQILYSAYVRNAKFTSPTTLPFIQLMQHSLVEIGKIDVGLTYRYAFVYIRQLAIHLRNAITVKKKVSYAMFSAVIYMPF